MKVLGLIPARGGSKRVPRKNLLQIEGKPLVVRALETSSQVKEISNLIVSTDDSEIARVCKDHGYNANVPWIRPSKLSADDSSSIDVALHALEYFHKLGEHFDALVLLQPTSPFRTSETIRDAIHLFFASNQKAVIGVSHAATHPMMTLKQEDGYLYPYLENNGFDKPSQDLPPIFEVNGSIYVISPEELEKERTFIPRQAIPLVIKSSKESLDIDTKSDVDLANYYAKN